MEGGWKTPPPRVSSRAKSPGLIGLTHFPVFVALCLKLVENIDQMHENTFFSC